MATEQEKAELSKRRGQAAAQITDPDQRRAFISAQGEAEKKGKGSASDADYQKLGKEADDTMATGGLNKSVGLPSYKKGTDFVPKTGPAIIHRGEKIVPAKENKEEKSESKDNAVEEAVEHTPSEKAHFHRAMAHLHAGALHRHLGIPEGKPIPMDKKQEAANSDNPHVAAMGRMAVAMHGWKHKK
jgi:hypothetical protein